MGEGRGIGDPGGSQPPVDLAAVSEIDQLDRSPRRRRGRIAVALTASVCVVAVAVAVVAAQPDGADRHRADRKVVKGPEAQAVFAALGETTASGSYDATYEFHTTPGAQPPLPPDACSGRVIESSGPDGSRQQSRVAVGSCAYAPTQAIAIAGRATINTDPYRMISSSDVTGFGPITVRVDGTRLWETGGGNYGLTGRGGDKDQGAPISGFASLVMGTLGPGPGALTMLTIASPNGYLNLQKEAVSGVTAAGTGVVDGVPVTSYEVTIDPAKLLDVPGLRSEQSKTITEALAQLRGAGYRDTTTKVGIDAAGLIRETTSVAKFDDGTQMTSHTVLSNFGCAGIVHLPGDPPSTTAPAPCVPPPPTTTVAPSTNPSPTTTTTATSSTSTASTSTITSSSTSTTTVGG